MWTIAIKIDQEQKHFGTNPPVHKIKLDCNQVFSIAIKNALKLKVSLTAGSGYDIISFISLSASGLGFGVIFPSGPNTVCDK